VAAVPSLPTSFARLAQGLSGSSPRRRRLPRRLKRASHAAGLQSRWGKFSGEVRSHGTKNPPTCWLCIQTLLLPFSRMTSRIPKGSICRERAQEQAAQASRLRPQLQQPKPPGTPSKFSPVGALASGAEEQAGEGHELFCAALLLVSALAQTGYLRLTSPSSSLGPRGRLARQGQESARPRFLQTGRAGLPPLLPWPSGRARQAGGDRSNVGAWIVYTMEKSLEAAPDQLMTPAVYRCILACTASVQVSPKGKPWHTLHLCNETAWEAGAAQDCQRSTSHHQWRDSFVPMCDLGQWSGMCLCPSDPRGMALFSSSHSLSFSGHCCAPSQRHLQRSSWQYFK